jgi:CrcB protein
MRYLLSGFITNQSKSAFPYGTIVVNVIGCFVVGLLGALLMDTANVREELRVGIFVGVLGGFTTFSAFGWETMALVRSEQYTLAAINVIASTVLGLLAVWVGYKLGMIAQGV